MEFFSMLNLSRSSRLEEVEQMYRFFSRLYHPDKAQVGSDQIFLDVKFANEILSEEHLFNLCKRFYDDREFCKWLREVHSTRRNILEESEASLAMMYEVSKFKRPVNLLASERSEFSMGSIKSAASLGFATLSVQLAPTNLIDKLSIDVDNETKTRYGTVYYGCEFAQLCPSDAEGDELAVYSVPATDDTYHYSIEPYVTVAGVNFLIPTSITVDYLDGQIDDYGIFEPRPSVSIKPTLRVLAADYPLEQKFLPEKVTSYAQFRLDTFVFNPSNWKVATPFKFMVCPSGVQNMKSHGNIGIEWNPFNPKRVEVFVELPMFTFCLCETIYLVSGSFKIKFLDVIKSRESWIPRGEIIIRKQNGSGKEESIQEILSLTFKNLHDRKDKATRIEKKDENGEIKKYVMPTLTVMLNYIFIQGNNLMASFPLSVPFSMRRFRTDTVSALEEVIVPLAVALFYRIKEVPTVEAHLKNALGECLSNIDPYLTVTLQTLRFFKLV